MIKIYILLIYLICSYIFFSAFDIVMTWCGVQEVIEILFLSFWCQKLVLCLTMSYFDIYWSSLLGNLCWKRISLIYILIWYMHMHLSYQFFIYNSVFLLYRFRGGKQSDCEGIREYGWKWVCSSWGGSFRFERIASWKTRNSG